MFEIVEHTADLGLRISADSVGQLFQDAARGLFSMIVVNLQDVHPLQESRFDLTGDQYDFLLLDWLNELLFAFETQRILFCEFDVVIADHALSAVARGEPMDVERHQMDHEVKAITYHHLEVRQVGGKWQGNVIVDI